MIVLQWFERLLTGLGRRFPASRLVSSPCFRYGARIANGGGPLDRWATLRDGSLLHVSLDEAIFRHLYFFGQYEEHVTDLMLRVARPGQVWLDVGANVGVFSLLLGKRVAPDGRVHSFEPNPAMARHLRLSLDRNGRSNVQLHPCALAEKPGEMQLHLPRNVDTTDGGSGRGSLLQQTDIPDEISVTVPTSTLDIELASESRPIFGMKIDVEGFESAVIDGASQLFTQRAPKIIFSEITHRPGALLPPADLIAKFVSLGYSSYRTQPFRPYQAGEALDPIRDADFIFVHRSAPELIEMISRSNAMR